MMPETRFRALDSWRGICATLVAVGHLAVASHLVQMRFFANYYLWVDFFFVLSGFVVTHAYGERLKSLASIGQFVVRRFGRLWPLHVTMLAAFVAMELVKLAFVHYGHMQVKFPPFTGGTDANYIIPNLLLIHALGFIPRETWNAPSWSISVEFYTYLVFVALVSIGGFVSRILRQNTLFVLAVGIAILSSVYLSMVAPSLSTTTTFGFVRCLYGFFTGQATYYLLQTHSVPSKAASVLEALCVVVVVAFVTYAGRLPAALCAPLIFGATIWLFARESGSVSKFLSRPMFIFVGERSYSIYMVHSFLIVVSLSIVDQVVRHVNVSRWIAVEPLSATHDLPVVKFPSLYAGDITVVLFIAAVLAVSTLTYRFVEQPGRSFFNRISKSMLTGKSAATESIRTAAPINEPQ